MLTRTILIPLDGSQHSDRMLWDVRRLLLAREEDTVRRKEGEIVLLRVVLPFAHPTAEESGGRQDSLRLRTQAARRHLSRLQGELQAQGLVTQTKVLLGDPAAVILRRAKQMDASLVAMATHGRSGPERWVRGSVAERVLRSCPVPVLLCNPGEEDTRPSGLAFRRILVPLDGSEGATEILPLANEFARLHGSEIILMRVGWAPYAGAVDYPPMGPGHIPPSDADLLTSLKPYREQFPGREPRLHVTVGDPAGMILAAVESLDVDLVAMTTHGWSGLDRWAFGSVAENVIRHCPCPLLVKRIAAFPSAEQLNDAGEEPGKDEEA